VELAAIVMASAAAAAGAVLLPESLGAGELALTAASLLLGQGLLRDLWLKYGAQAGHSCAPVPGGKAVCAESGLGIAVVIAGTALLLSGAGGAVQLSPARWAGLFLGAGALGFALRNVVVDLRARRIRVEKDHRSIVLW
jgi:hypothetical protein